MSFIGEEIKISRISKFRISIVILEKKTKVSMVFSRKVIKYLSCIPTKMLMEVVIKDSGA